MCYIDTITENEQFGWRANVIQMAYFLNYLSKKNKKRDNRPLKTHGILFWSKVLHGGQNHRHEKIVFYLILRFT